MLQNIFTSGVDQEGGLEQTTFLVIVIAIVWGWILVSMFQRITENLAFQTLGMNPRSTIHAIIIGAVMLFLFILFIWFIDELELIPVSAATSELAEATAGLLAATEDSTAPSNAVTQQLSNTKNGHPIVLLNTGY